MGTATKVPQTRMMKGDELSADDALSALRKYGGWALVRDSFVRYRYGDGNSHARAVALQTCLAVIPGLIAVVGLSQVIHAERIGELLRAVVSNLAPGDSGDAIRETIGQDASGSGGTLALVLGLLTSVFAMTTGMAQIERGANRIYGVERDRPFKRKYGRALLLTVAAGVPLALGFTILVAGGAIGDAIDEVYGWSDGMSAGFDIVRWPLGFLLAVLSISVVFRAAPRRRQPGHTWLAVGAILAVLLWMVVTWALAYYTSGNGNFGAMYGPLTAMMALLLWSMASSMALFFGLAFAAQLEAVRVGRARPAAPDPGPTLEQERGTPGVAIVEKVRQIVGEAL